MEEEKSYQEIRKEAIEKYKAKVVSKLAGIEEKRKKYLKSINILAKFYLLFQNMVIYL